MSKKYSCAEIIFDDLSNPETCYWLGVLTSDGWVSGTHVGLELTVRDHLWLEKFKQFLFYTGPIRIYPPSRSGKGGGDRCRLLVNSSYMVHSLNELGLDNKKSHTARFCKDIPEQSIKHYIRGLTDGDGHLAYHTQRNTWDWGMTGTQQLLEGIRHHLLIALPDIDLDIHQDPRSYFYCLRSYHSYSTRQIAEYLYGDASVYLDRKKELADQICRNEYQKPNIYRNYSELDIKRLKKELGTWGKVASHIGVQPSQLRKMRHNREMDMDFDYSCRFVSQNITESEIQQLYQIHRNWIKVSDVLGITDRQLRRIRNKL